ncbi:MAG: Thiamin-phosphate pyrophosphorylase (EC [uncultured Thiotrichaceae bacterium]|uniref:Thiamine-phosphate synthase n=1 Tax=uncultured Thiotrichaceae bacterium TaxID=298394 RepID=A0A6S6T802_9GAMM|nr:MAG: Thiamin-phosphate pyrophosphorylase (EC [uncultured Thiotrichaceae bacterium]
MLIDCADPPDADLHTDWRLAESLGLQTYTVLAAYSATPIAEQFQQIRQSLCTNDALPLAAIKVGRLVDEVDDQVVTAVYDGIVALQEQGQRPRIIIDPILVTDSGERLLTPQGEQVLRSKLLPLADVVTPDLNELALLTKLTTADSDSINCAVKQLIASGVTSVLLRNTHLTAHQVNGDVSHEYNDYFFSENLHFWLMGKHYPPEQINIPGTGSLFATAIACASAQGYSVTDAIILAKTLVNRSVRQSHPTQETYQLCVAETNPDDWGVDYQDFPKLTPHSPEISPPVLPRCDTLTLGIYPVVDSVEWIEKLINCGIQTIQLRLKTDIEHPPTPAELDGQIQAAVTVCKGRNIRLFINDHWQLAIKHRAYGIHLGQEDLHDADLQAIAAAGCHLGVSTHSYTEVARALWVNPSYIALGPIYATTSKQMPWIPQGVAAVERWTALLGGKYPLVAIGGIDLARATALKPTGIGSVAMISAITQAADYRQATQELLELWQQ